MRIVRVPEFTWHYQVFCLVAWSTVPELSGHFSEFFSEVWSLGHCILKQLKGTTYIRDLMWATTTQQVILLWPKLYHLDRNLEVKAFYSFLDFYLAGSSTKIIFSVVDPTYRMSTLAKYKLRLKTLQGTKAVISGNIWVSVFVITQITERTPLWLFSVGKLNNNKKM